MRRLEGEHLALASERLLDLDQRRAAARGDHQLGGIVVDDAAMRSRVETFADEFLTIEILGAAADDAQRRMRRGRGSNALAPGADDVAHRCHGPFMAEAPGCRRDRRDLPLGAASASHSSMAGNASSAWQVTRRQAPSTRHRSCGSETPPGTRTRRRCRTLRTGNCPARRTARALRARSRRCAR